MLFGGILLYFWMVRVLGSFLGFGVFLIGGS